MNVKNYFSENSDRLFIEGFVVACRVGHTARERAFPQLIQLDVTLWTPLAKPARTDRMRDAVDYAVLIGKIRSLLSKKSFVLIESLAGAIADIALDFHAITAVEVKASKRVFADVKGVGAIIFRRRN